MARLRLVRDGPNESVVAAFKDVLASNDRLTVRHIDDRMPDDQVYGEIGIVLNKLGEHVRSAEAFELAVAYKGPEHVNAGIYTNAAVLGWLPLHDLHGEHAGRVRGGGGFAARSAASSGR